MISFSDIRAELARHLADLGKVEVRIPTRASLEGVGMDFEQPLVLITEQDGATLVIELGEPPGERQYPSLEAAVESLGLTLDQLEPAESPDIHEYAIVAFDWHAGEGEVIEWSASETIVQRRIAAVTAKLEHASFLAAYSRDGREVVGLKGKRVHVEMVDVARLKARPKEPLPENGSSSLEFSDARTCFPQPV